MNIPFFKKKSGLSYPTITIVDDIKHHKFMMYRKTSSGRIGMTLSTELSFDTYAVGIAGVRDLLDNWERDVTTMQSILGKPFIDPILSFFKTVNVYGVHNHMDQLARQCFSDVNSWLLFKKYLTGVNLLINPLVVDLGKYKFIQTLLQTVTVYEFTSDDTPSVVRLPAVQQPISDGNDVVQDINQFVSKKSIDPYVLNKIFDLLILHPWIWLVPLYRYYNTEQPSNALFYGDEITA